MVALRSRRADRAPLVAVWVLGLAVLGVGIAAVSPILIIWGVLGVAGSAFATRIHLRDTGLHRPREDTETSTPTETLTPTETSTPASTPTQVGSSGPSDSSSVSDSPGSSGRADPVEQEHLR
ncbi:hypothetical protein [Frankia sp. Cas3]|uniref:hypothetical protein n=1 Tax=Frankia sp. Cas3 TaxID=3073926 RepID=UPI002AD3E90C|nr:hypothetical protein [Frankia sp. Cas3]